MPRGKGRGRKAAEQDLGDELAKGKGLASEGKLEEAVVCFKNVLEAHPDDAEANMRMGLAMCDLGKKKSAVSYFDKALEADPRNPEAWLRKAQAIATEGPSKNDEKVLEFIDKALEIDPDYIDALNLKGAMLNSMKDHEGALKLLERLLTIDARDPERPRAARIHTDMGAQLTSLGRYDEAIKEFDKALEANPDYTLARLFKEDTQKKLAGRSK
jgi:tetratricopeptide (TPR) repeat protein